MYDTLIEANRVLEEQIIERKRAEDRFRALLESAPDAFIIVNANGQITLVNVQTENIFGYVRSELLGKPIEMLIPERFRGHHTAHRNHYATEPHMRGMGVDLELYALRKDGHEFSVEISLSPIETDEGLLTACAIRNTTESKKNERLLRFHASLQENVSDAVIATDLEFRIQSWNHAAEIIYGWCAEEVIGKLTTDVLQTRYESEAIREHIRQEFLRRGSWHGEFIQRRKDGTEIYILGSTTLFKDHKGQPFGIVSVNHDITERKQTEAALRESERRLNLLSQHSPDAIYILDLSKPQMTYLNRPQFLGYSQNEIKGEGSLLSALHPEDRARVLAHWREKVLEGRLNSSSMIEYRLQDKEGLWQWVLSRETIFDATPEGKPTQVLVTLTVITERKQAEQQALELIKERERVKILSNFVKDTSHDFRTPLSTISTSLYLLSKVTDPEKQQKYIDNAEQQISRLTYLIDRLHIMGRLDSQMVLALRRLDVNQVISDLRTKMESAIKEKGLTVIYSLWESSLIVQADPEELSLAVEELGKNAVWYTPTNGTITVSTRRQDNQAIIEVSDSGVGISSTHLPHIFERLYRVDAARSTDTGGVGLGLSIAKRIIELHEGNIEVESVSGKGSVFRVFLPLAP